MLREFVAHLHRTGALSVPPGDLEHVIKWFEKKHRP